MKASIRNTCYAILLCLLTFVLSCKKMNLTDLESGNIIVERFLKIPQNAHPAIIRVSNDMRTKNSNRPFIEEFVKNHGYPNWEKAIIKYHISDMNWVTEPESDSIVLVPFVIDNEALVNSILDCNLNGEVYYKLFEGVNYKFHGWNKDTDRIDPNAEDVASMIMFMENIIFGENTFKVFDSLLFNDIELEYNSTRFVSLLREEDEDTGCYEWWETVSTDGGITFHDTGVFLGYEGNCEQNGNSSIIWYFITQITDPENPSYPQGGGGGSSYNPNVPQCTLGWIRVPSLSIQNGSSLGLDYDPCMYMIINPVSVEYIENLLVDPCKKEAFDKISADGLRNSLYNLYSSTFVGNNSTHNLKIREVPSILIPTSAGLVPAPARSYSDPNPNNQNTWIIELSNQFPSSFTQEFWGTTLLHELVHGFIRKNYLSFYPSSVFTDLHEIMLDKWILEIKSALIESFNIPEQDALALSLDGFDDILKDMNNEFIDDMKTWMETKYSVDLNVMENLSLEYYTGSKGNVCL